MAEELEVFRFGDIGRQTGALGCEVFLVAGIEGEREDMPGVKGLAIACLEGERGNLVLWRKGGQSGDRDGVTVCLRGERSWWYKLANPHCSGLLTSCQRRELNLWAYKKLWENGLVNARPAPYTTETRDLFLLALEERRRAQCEERDIEAKGHSDNGANGDICGRVAHSQREPG